MKNLIEALIKAQQEFPPVEKNKTGVHGSTYAPLEELVSKCLPILNKHGLTISQAISELDSGKMAVVTSLLHSSGDSLSSTMAFAPPNDPQKVGGFITYYRRYSYGAIIGVATEDDLDGDDISKSAQQKKKEQENPELYKIKIMKGNKVNGKTLDEIPDSILQEQLEYWRPKNPKGALLEECKIISLYLESKQP